MFALLSPLSRTYRGPSLRPQQALLFPYSSSTQALQPDSERVKEDGGSQSGCDDEEPKHESSVQTRYGEARISNPSGYKYSHMMRQVNSVPTWPILHMYPLNLISLFQWSIQ